MPEFSEVMRMDCFTMARERFRFSAIWALLMPKAASLATSRSLGETVVCSCPHRAGELAPSLVMHFVELFYFLPNPRVYLLDPFLLQRSKYPIVLRQQTVEPIRHCQRNRPINMIRRIGRNHDAIAKACDTRHFLYTERSFAKDGTLCNLGR